MIFSFVLTTSVSAAMACCWKVTKNDVIAEPSCHDSDTKDTDQSDVANTCCDDMALCKVPLVYGSADSVSGLMMAQNDMLPISPEWAFSESTGPPTPPPKLFL